MSYDSSTLDPSAEYEILLNRSDETPGGGDVLVTLSASTATSTSDETMQMVLDYLADSEDFTVVLARKNQVSRQTISPTP